MFEAAAILLPVLSEDLVGEILLRLPVRSLIQFKCVCKSWKILISSSQFANNHLHISTSGPTITNQQLVFSDSERPWIIESYPLKPFFENPSTPVKHVAFIYKEENRYCIIGSCNGLLCLLDTFRHCSFRLCNPSLRLISKLSSVPVSQDWSFVHCGFGYDEVNDKYKVLLAMQTEDHQTLTKIYIPLVKMIPGKKETYTELLLPKNDGHNNVCAYPKLFVLKNSLCVSVYIDSEGFDWILWMMKEYGVVESWTKFMIIPCDKLLQNGTCLVEPLFISQNGVLMVKMGGQLILYNSNNGVALDPLIVMKLDFYLHLHCESLVSLSC